MNKILLLDSNVYIEIERKLSKQKYSKERIDTLKKHDQYGTFILPLSIIEGEESKVEENQVKYKLFLKIIQTLKEFFKKAKTFHPDVLKNDLINQELKDILKDVFLDQKKDLNSVTNFLLDINEMLQDNVSKEKYQEVERDIIHTAIKYKLNIHNPIVFCTFLVLYKNKEIRKLYKFGKNYHTKVYNVLSDFNILKQYAMIKKNLRDRNESSKIKFLTFDTALIYLSRHLNIELIENSLDMVYTITFSPQLLMDTDSKLSEEESFTIFNRIYNYYEEKTKN